MTPASPSTPDSRRAAVIGGGLIGCAVARALARDGFAVTLYERDADPGRRASGAAAGMLAPQMEEARHPAAPADPEATRAMRAFSLRARDAYPGFVRDLEAESGRAVPLLETGTLVVALDERGAAGLETSAEAQRAEGLSAEFLDGRAARSLEPALGPAVLAALRLPDDHAVDNVALGRAALEAAAARGVTIATRSPVEAIVVRDGAVAGVRVAAETRTAGVVVIAAGAWSGRIEGLPRPLPIRPVRGQIGAVVPDRPPRAIVAGPGAYCVPREDGRVLVGATMEEVGFDDGVDGTVVRGLVAAAARFLPGLAAAGPAEAWAGLRPAAPDGLPVLGADPDVDGLLYATGHFRNGILLAPVTAEVIAALAAGAPPPIDVAPFRPERFE